MIRKWEDTEGAKLLEGLRQRGVRFFGIDEVQVICNKNYQTIVKMLQRLIQHGEVVRINRGRYGLVEDGERIHPLVVARELAGGSGTGGSLTRPYYISHGSAMAVWGMTSAYGMLREPRPSPTLTPALSQLPAGGLRREREKPVEVIVSLKGRRLPRREVMGVRYRFVNGAEMDPGRMTRLRKPRPKQWLTTEVEVTPGEFVRVSDPEWTIAGGLGRPDLCGGVAGLWRALEIWKERIDLDRLIRYARITRNRTAARRLGYLLDLTGMQTWETRFWLKVAVYRNDQRLEPGVRGKREGRWRLEVREGF